MPFLSTAFAIAAFLAVATLAPVSAMAQEATQGATQETAREMESDDDPFRLGAQTFNAHCAACHSGSPESLGFGPPLTGILGRDAATYDVYPAYSDALKTSGLVWDEETLRAWIVDSEKMVPETTMPVIALSEAQIDALMVYLVFISE